MKLDELAERCGTCRFSVGSDCNRIGKIYSQAYETKHTDSDFCGPQRRYYEPRGFAATLRRILAALRARSADNG